MPADSEGTRFNTKKKKKKELKLQIKEKKKEKEITWKDAEDNQARQSRKTIMKDNQERPSCLEFLSIENECGSSTKNSIRKNTRERIFLDGKPLRRRKERKEI